MGFIALDTIVRDALGNSETLHQYPYLLKYALRIVRELSINHLPTAVKTVIIEMNDNNTIDLPKDYVDYTKIGLKGSDGNIKVLGVNDDIILVDDKSDCGNPKARSITSDTRRNNNVDLSENGFVFFNFTQEGLFQGVLYGHGGGYSRGAYRLNLEAWQIQFSSDFTDRKIVLEYSHNGINTSGQTMVIEQAYDTIYFGIKWYESLEKKSASWTDRNNYERLHKAALDTLRRSIYGFTISEFKQALRSAYTQSAKQ